MGHGRRKSDPRNWLSRKEALEIWLVVTYRGIERREKYCLKICFVSCYFCVPWRINVKTGAAHSFVEIIG